MAIMTLKGFSDVEAMLATVQEQAEEIAKAALYDGAGVVADSIKSGINSIPFTNAYGYPERKNRGPSLTDKEGLRDSFGISTMRTESGAVNVSLGFDGYNSRGKANAMIARSVERGTSFMYSTPFVKSSVSRSKASATAAIVKKADEEIKKITK